MNRGLSGVVPRKNKQTLLLGPEEAQLGLSGRESQGGTIFELSAQMGKENIALEGVGSCQRLGQGHEWAVWIQPRNGSRCQSRQAYRGCARHWSAHG